MQQHKKRPIITTEIQAIIASISTLIKQHAKPVLMVSEFHSLLSKYLPKNIRANVMEDILEETGIIQRKILRSDDYRDIGRISVPSLNPTPYHYAVSLRGEAYLSHSSAVHLLGLTQQQPKIIYANKEQSKKPQSEGILSQESIDRAFSRPQRRSKYVFRIDGFQIVLLSGKSTGRAGVINNEITGLPITCLERTLIDITVRPRYAGGVFQVFQAFKEAVNEIDTTKMLSLLSTIDHRYPYHQALGFYLERAGANSDILNQLKGMGLNFDFYLDYSMADPNFDKSWRVFYPLGI
jgi:predicted transcriptional regulator of viral defense system